MNHKSLGLFFALTILLFEAGCFRAVHSNPMDPDNSTYTNGGLQPFSIPPVMVSTSPTLSISSNGSATNYFPLGVMANNFTSGTSYRNFGFGRQYFAQYEYNSGSGFASLSIFVMGAYQNPAYSTNLSVQSHQQAGLAVTEASGGTYILVSTNSNTLATFLPNLTPDGSVNLPIANGNMAPSLQTLKAYGNNIFVLAGDFAYRINRGGSGVPSSVIWSNRILSGGSFNNSDRLAWNGQGKVVVIQGLSTQNLTSYVLNATDGSVLNVSTNLGGVGSTNVLWVDRLQVSSVEGWNGNLFLIASAFGTGEIVPRFLEVPEGYGVATERRASPPFKAISYSLHANGGILLGHGGLVAQFTSGDSQERGLRFYQFAP